MKLPRDVDAAGLIKALSRIGYHVVRQSDSHIRLQCAEPPHAITVPNHSPLRIGTLASTSPTLRTAGASAGTL